MTLSTLGTGEESGQQELLNWMCLTGAMAELGRKPTETAWVETHIFNYSGIRFHDLIFWIGL